jgi:hypothetical protein
MQASGENGYYGYAWSRIDRDLGLDIWYLDGSPENRISVELETIEVEVVSLFRMDGIGTMAQRPDSLRNPSPMRLPSLFWRGVSFNSAFFFSIQ